MVTQVTSIIHLNLIRVGVLFLGCKNKCGCAIVVGSLSQIIKLKVRTCVENCRKIVRL